MEFTAALLLCRERESGLNWDVYGSVHHAFVFPLSSVLPAKSSSDIHLHAFHQLRFPEVVAELQKSQSCNNNYKKAEENTIREPAP